LRVPPEHTGQQRHQSTRKSRAELSTPSEIEEAANYQGERGALDLVGDVCAS
jgi:hypothetical protein